MRKYKLLEIGIILISLMALAWNVGPAYAGGPTANFTLTCSSVSGTISDPGHTVFGISLTDGATQTVVFAQTVNSTSFSITFSGVSGGDSLTLVVSDSEGFGNVYSSLSCGPGGVNGSGGTNGGGTFVLKTAVCDTPLFDAPDGNAISSTAIKSGQTWYVGTASSSDPLGRSWVRVSIGSSTNFWLPSDCVQ